MQSRPPGISIVYEIVLRTIGEGFVEIHYKVSMFDFGGEEMTVNEGGHFFQTLSKFFKLPPTQFSYKNLWSHQPEFPLKHSFNISLLKWHFEIINRVLSRYPV